MGLSEELKELEALRERGVLDEEEFQRAKERVLSGGATPDLNRHLEHVRRETELARLDREWAMERESFLVAGKYGRRYLPTEGGSIATGIVVVVFGLFWTAMASGITGMGAGAGFGGVFGLFPLFGLLFIGVGVAASVGGYRKAQAYRAAEARYRERRERLLSDDSR
jgi:hypothetical protein